MHIRELDTPALLIDLDVMERNLRRVAEYATAHNLRLRPHTKTHKIPALARKQIELGAAGITVAKTTEAEVMLESDPPDLLVAYPVIGAKKLERLMNVAKRTTVTVALDNAQTLQCLSDAAASASQEIGVLAEIDVGLGRVGVTVAELPALVDQIDKASGLRFEGIAFYPGHIKQTDDATPAALNGVSELLDQAIHAIGRQPAIVSGGSTPALFHSHLVRHMNEIRPGTYIFNDRNTVACGACEWSDCAASILTTVVSTAVKGQMIIDGGSKTFSSDRLSTTGEATFGRLVEAPEAVFTRMNEEHGFVDIASVRESFAVGDRVRMIPNHICVAMNLQERVYGIRGDQVEQVWEVSGRGKLQ